MGAPNAAITPQSHASRRWAVRIRLLRGSLSYFWHGLVRRPMALLGGIVVLVYILAAIFAPHITVHDPIKGDLHKRLLPPAWQDGGDPAHLLGTDSLGYDILTRMIFGTRVSLLVGFLSVGIFVAVGTALGALAGYYGGLLDNVISRVTDLLLAFPLLIFAIAVVAFLGPGLTNLMVALSLKGWVGFFRLVRGEMMAEKTKEYVKAAKVVGQSDLAIIASEIMPNIVHSVLVLATLRLGSMVQAAAALDFLGLGVQPPTPVLGRMVGEGRNFILNAWWISTFPGIAIVLLVVSINVFGEGLRDILDPRQKVE